jgi:hypothetical protein
LSDRTKALTARNPRKTEIDTMLRRPASELSLNYVMSLAGEEPSHWLSSIANLLSRGSPGMQALQDRKFEAGMKKNPVGT